MSIDRESGIVRVHPLNNLNVILVGLFSWLLVMILVGCQGAEPPAITSYLEGNLTVSSDVDSSGDFSGFEVAILSTAEGDDVDTLGYGVTDRSGFFSMNIRASEKGIYPIEIRRNDRVLARSQYVLANGDSATMNVKFPMTRNFLMVRSEENGAWLAYRNTKALHNQRLLDVTQTEGATLANVGTVIEQTSSIFWSMEETYPGTMGSELARSESIVMLEGWNDSLVIVRAREIQSDEAGYMSVVQALRRSVARQYGLQAAIDTLSAVQRTIGDPDHRDAILAEKVLAYMDSSDTENARVAATTLSTKGATENWKQWAGRVVYELDHLMPGMVAPNAQFKDLSGRDLDLEFFMEIPTLLEFIDPGVPLDPDEQFRRSNLLSLSDGTNFQIITVSVNPDRALNELYLENKTTLEAYVVPNEGLDSELATTYNVQSVPKRFLINKGKIVSKYSNSSVRGIRQDVLSVVNRNNAP